MDFSENTMRKARGVLARHELRVDEKNPLIWWVESSDGSREYRVQLILSEQGTLLTCTCEHGMKAGHEGMVRCYHGAAAVLSLEEKCFERVQVDGRSVPRVSIAYAAAMARRREREKEERS